MHKGLKKILWSQFPFFMRIAKAVRMATDGNSYLYSSGLMKSYELASPVDYSGNPLPWMSLPVINFLSEKLSKDMVMLEYGSGHSTLFFQKKVKTLYSVESDLKWYQVIKEKIAENVQYFCATTEREYLDVFDVSHYLIDVVIVDGDYRNECIKKILSKVNDNTVIVVDDSNRGHVREGVQLLLLAGYRFIHFDGIQANGYRFHRTSVYYKNGNSLGI